MTLKFFYYFLESKQNWPENQRLASWVNVQRQFRKLGKLAADREEKLDREGFDWEPLEISIVSVPADPNVGVGRSLETGSPSGATLNEQKNL